MVTSKQWLIYVLKDPLTDEIRYVGATSRGIKNRLISHLSEAKAKNYHKRARRCIWIRSILDRGVSPVALAFVSVIPSCRWQDVEIAIIAQMRSDGIRLVNGTNGGEGVSGREWKPNAEQIEKIRLAGIGRKPTEETRRKRSASLKAYYANDPVAMERRKEMARQAGRSKNGREAASKRMIAMWADPERAAQVRSRMRGSKDPEMRRILGE